MYIKTHTIASTQNNENIECKRYMPTVHTHEYIYI